MKLLLTALVLVSAVAAPAFADLSAISTDAGTVRLSKREQAEKALMVEPAYEAPRGQLFDEQAYLAGDTDLNQFVNVIVINKAASGPRAQTLRMYTNHQLVLTTKVSTGTEELEYISPIRGIIHAIGKGSVHSHWRHTTRGFYTVKRVYDGNYQSGESKFHMPYAMFFNDDRGLAIHQVPPDLTGGEAAGIERLGHRASSGCVRVKAGYINMIHDAVVAADQGQIPVIDSKTGHQVIDDNGQPETKTGYRSIVIVEEY